MVLLIEVLGALRPVRLERFERKSSAELTRLAILVPAHNEGTEIVPTLSDLRQQLSSGDRLLVIADNCTDNTAEIALANGAEVIRRDEPDKVGKGYAMARGIMHLSSDPPDLVFFVDADCRVESDLIHRSRIVCQEIRRPVQTLNLMQNAKNSPINHDLAEFAWILKNHVRPLGLRNLHLPVQLTGTGMIFPWEAISAMPLARGDLVEDLKLGLDLAAAGRAPHFFPFVRVTSEFPVTKVGAESQRQRWVQGSIGTILGSVPKLLWLSLRHRNLNLLVLTLDLVVLPLSLLSLLIIGLLGIACLVSLLGFGSFALLISVGNLAAFCLSVTLAWFAFGQQALPRSRLRLLPPFFLQKVGFYGRFLVGKTATHWIRTDRTKIK
jgi:glycosyltransferase involved in cell wall biosynthesis